MVTYIPMPETMEYMTRLQDAAYDEGYDDASLGRPRKDAGDLQLDYDAGYDDAEQEIYYYDDEGSEE